MQVRGRSRRAGQCGFSLIEVLMAMVMVVIVGGILYSVFYQSVKVWKRAAKASQEVDIYIMADKISTDVRSAFAFEGKALKGSETGFSLYTMLKTPERIRDKAGSFETVGRVSYAFEESEGAVLRMYDDFPELLRPSKYFTKPKEKMADNILNCTFEYYRPNPNRKDYEWARSWDESCMPRAIRIRLRFVDNNKTRNIAKIIPIPATGCMG